MGDLLEDRFYADLERDQQQHGHHVDAGAAPDDQHDGARRCVGPGRVRPRRSTPTRSAATCSRSPRDRLAPTGHPPARIARLAARARHVGGRGPDPPLPDQGARRAALHLPAVLRPLHAHGPGRQLDAADRQAQVRPASRSTGTTRSSSTCAATPRCATSWSPAATSPTCHGAASSRSLTRLLDIDNIRDIRLATKALMGLPQHWLQDDVRRGHGAAWPSVARARGVDLAIHTHVNHAALGDPAGRQGRARLLEVGVRDVRNQGVLMRGVNDHAGAAARPVLRAAWTTRGSCRTTSTCAT